MQSLFDFTNKNYRLQSLNIYKGDGEKGHYISINNNVDNYYVYDDLIVTKRESIELFC
jgi:ubiquitin C-terminal hydrolase